jgi:polyphenol oxidase
MVIIRSAIFNQFKEISFAYSTLVGGDEPYHFNLSLSVGDIKDKVIKRRKIFFESAGLDPGMAVIQKQVHGDKIRYINSPGGIEESDAMITDKKGIGLAISSADCAALFLFDRKNKIIAGIHSGWRSTAKKITYKTVEKLINEFSSQPGNIYAYIAPSISAECYQFGAEALEYFDEKYLLKKEEKFYLNIPQANIDMLTDAGVPVNQIQVSELCTFGCSGLLHSYRRGGIKSGRAYGVIALTK